ncbi:MAG: N-acetyltransferase family protein [Clostridiaceae bacterium]|nr:N-acetyltransferase family protein [Clostridiaceae bacterium]
MDLQRAICIRKAVIEDNTGIGRIMAWFIANTQSSWRYQALDKKEVERWLGEHLAHPVHQVWVAEIEDRIIGYSCLSDFRSGEGYWPCAEDSIYVLPDYAGQGIGTMLMNCILRQAGVSHLKTVVAAIDSENQNSIRFHQRFGFRRSGYLQNVGWKNNHCLDLVLMVYAVPE